MSALGLLLAFYFLVLIKPSNMTSKWDHQMKCTKLSVSRPTYRKIGRFFNPSPTLQMSFIDGLLPGSIIPKLSWAQAHCGIVGVFLQSPRRRRRPFHISAAVPLFLSSSERAASERANICLSAAANSTSRLAWRPTAVRRRTEEIESKKTFHETMQIFFSEVICI